MNSQYFKVLVFSSVLLSFCASYVLASSPASQAPQKGITPFVSSHQAVFTPTPVSETATPSALRNAKDAFDRKNFSTALSLYQTVLNKHVPQSNPNPSESPAPARTPTLAQKIVSFLKEKFSPSTPNPGSNNFLNGYLYLQMGKCYVGLKKMDQAESAYAMGVTAGGNNDMGNQCLFEEGYCQMYRKDYQDAYQNLKEYVSRNIQKDPSGMDPNRMKRAVFMASVCAWKLNKSGVDFESDMPGAKALAKQAFALLPALDNRIYFKKTTQLKPPAANQ